MMAVALSLVALVEMGCRGPEGAAVASSRPPPLFLELVGCLCLAVVFH